MARTSDSTISQGELYPQADEFAREQLDDARLLDLDVEEQSPFLRRQKRISVRRVSLPRKTAILLSWAALALTSVFFGGVAVAALYRYGEHSWRFRIASSDDIEITGVDNVTRLQVMEVMGEDIGRNVFFIPLGQRKKHLEQIPWVESASVMRFAPHRLKIEIHERTPVAFARLGSRILLTDPVGTLMELPIARRKKFSFPVILGMNLGEPPSTRAARMKIYNDLIAQLDSGGALYSQDLSEVDLSDPDDVKVLAGDPGGELLVHLGSSDFLERFKIYKVHVREWRQQFARLDSVDLRFEHQIVINPDLQGTVKQPPLSMFAMQAATAAGVKPAALLSHEPASWKPMAPVKPVSTKPATRALPTRHRNVRARRKRFLKKNHAKTAVIPNRPPSGSAGPWSALRVKTVAGQAQGGGDVGHKNGLTTPASSRAKLVNKPSPAIPKGKNTN